ncbi:MAG: ribosomal protein L25, Ctc-form [Parcubacteria bacterium C7867-007]|nr:MAG: ribosomal protein L25, Ctc-form [Parcubacteria bacterium C7867-007]
MNTLAAEPRSIIGKASKDLLLQDRMPAIVYGPKKEATPVTISLLEFKRILREGGESSVIDITGIGASMQVLVQEVDRDPVTNQPRHADFYAIEKGAKVEVAVPISFIGESPAVKEGANLVKVLHEIEVESDPSKLPHEIEVDISSLVAIGDQIHIKDIKFPTGVVVKLEEDEVVVLVQAIAEEEESTEAPNMDAIEVEQKGKADGASEEAAAE